PEISYVHLRVFLHCSRAHRDLHSFPTRRSSDLQGLLLNLRDCLQHAHEQSNAKRHNQHGRGEEECYEHCISGEVNDQRVRHRCRSEEHTSELQSRENLVCRLLLEKKKQNKTLLP